MARPGGGAARRALLSVQEAHQHAEHARRGHAFYFVHWLTDLAGAEPTPLQGAEKFVLRFPHSLLQAFIASFSFVGKLADKGETEVYDEYLAWRWRQLSADFPEFGPEPTGNYRIALMRLVVAAQTLPVQKDVFEAFNRQCHVRDQFVLSCEMALSGVVGQPFRPSHLEKDGAVLGPAFLVYYAPQFLRTAGHARQSADALQMLAEVYRQARSMWPLSKEKAGTTVTLRIDQLKDRTPTVIHDGHQWGDGWFLFKRNEREAVVEQRPFYAINASLQGEGEGQGSVRLLCLWKRLDEDVEEDNALFEELELVRLRQDEEQSRNAKGSPSGTGRKRRTSYEPLG